MNAARKKLEKALDDSFAPVREKEGEAYHEVVDLLRGFAERVAANVNPKSGAVAEVKVVPGHLVNQGQEHRIVIRAPEIGLSDTLLRAFVPADGYPVVLDLFSEGDRDCADTDALVKALIETSKLPWMGQRLKAIRNLLLDESMVVEPKTKAQAMKPAAKRTAKATETVTKDRNQVSRPRSHPAKVAADRQVLRAGSGKRKIKIPEPGGLTN